MLNKVILIGNVGKDPEIRKSKDGSEIANFSLATTESWKDKESGEKKSQTEWHKVVVFAPGIVKVIAQYVKKGSRLYIEGQNQTRKWQDKDGRDHYSTEVILKNFRSSLQLLNSMSDEDKQIFKEDQKAVQEMDNGRQFVEDEIPF